MSMTKEEIADWLSGLPDGALVGVDDGGLCLRVAGDEQIYCEVGGLPIEVEANEPDLTPQQVSTYLANRGSECPRCGDSDISGDSINFDGGEVSQKISCVACDFGWLDVYRLVGIAKVGSGDMYEPEL